MDYFNQNQNNLASLQNQLVQLQNVYNQLMQAQPQKAQAPASPGSATPILWVDGGLEGAKAVPMQPNTTAALFDRNDAVFYLRSLDANGVEAPIKIGRFTLEDAPAPESNVLTKKDLDDFRNEIRQMLQQQNQQNQGGYKNQNGQKNGNGNYSNNQEAKK